MNVTGKRNGNRPTGGVGATLTKSRTKADHHTQRAAQSGQQEAAGRRGTHTENTQTLVIFFGITVLGLGQVAGVSVKYRTGASLYSCLYYLSAKIVQAVVRVRGSPLLYLTKQESSMRGTAGCWWVSRPTHTARSGHRAGAGHSHSRELISVPGRESIMRTLVLSMSSYKSEPLTSACTILALILRFKKTKKWSSTGASL